MVRAAIDQASSQSIVVSNEFSVMFQVLKSIVNDKLVNHRSAPMSNDSELFPRVDTCRGTLACAT